MPASDDPGTALHDTDPKEPVGSLVASGLAPARTPLARLAAALADGPRAAREACDVARCAGRVWWQQPGPRARPARTYRSPAAQRLRVGARPPQGIGAGGRASTPLATPPTASMTSRALPLQTNCRPLCEYAAVEPLAQRGAGSSAASDDTASAQVPATEFETLKMPP
jgi:hypothetical protein